MNLTTEFLTTNYNVSTTTNVNEYIVKSEPIVTQYNVTTSSLGAKGDSGVTDKIQFTAVENQTEFELPINPTAIVFFTRNGIEIALNSRFIAGNKVIYVPIENNSETIKQNDRIIITYL